MPSLSSTGSDPAPLLDWDYLHRLSGQNASFEQELLHLLIKTLPPHIEALKQQISQGNAVQVGQEAHYIKGASLNVGVVGIANPAARLELICSSLEAPAGSSASLQAELDQATLLALGQQIDQGFQQLCRLVQAESLV